MSKERIAIVAFEGWNDAGEAASSAVDHLIEIYDTQLEYTFDAEAFYDLQVNRPFLKNSKNGQKEIVWRTTHIYKAQVPQIGTVTLVRGVEPSMNWSHFLNILIDKMNESRVTTVIALGALLSDTPHTHPTPITAVSFDDQTAMRFKVDISDYEGPTGIIGIMQQHLIKSKISGLSLWAAVPHYLSQGPSPKATSAILDSLDALIDIPIPLGDLPTKMELWLEQVDAMVNNDEELADYIKRLEETEKVSDLPMASGDAIAREFERYLRRRGIE